MSITIRDTSNTILSTAERLFNERGGPIVSMKDISEAAGISRQAVYLHFASRTSLISATLCFIDDASRNGDEFRHLREAQTGPEILYAFVEYWGNYVPKVYGAAKALMALRDKDEAAATVWEERMESFRNGCRRTIETIEHEGRLSPQWTVDEGVDLMSTMLSIESWERLTIERSWTTEEYVVRVNRALRQILLVPD
ncbi:MAG TPA: helix-turn-helix domain-containing protein [Pyrinomonadaceae bacterium]|nr:helix-turn-helix domain-containing protein [Pyrinomonadaceae bacterium]